MSRMKRETHSRLVHRTRTSCSKSRFLLSLSSPQFSTAPANALWLQSCAMAAPATFSNFSSGNGFRATSGCPSRGAVAPPVDAPFSFRDGAVSASEDVVASPRYRVWSDRGRFGLFGAGCRPLFGYRSELLAAVAVYKEAELFCASAAELLSAVASSVRHFQRCRMHLCADLAGGNTQFIC